MGAIAGATVGEIHERSAHGVVAIAMLAQGDAAALRIIHAGEVTKDACARAAARGQAALGETLETCVGVLREIDAPDAAFEIVFEARRRAGLAIGDARTGCHRHVNQAVMRALSGGHEGEGVGERAGLLLVE